MKAKGYKRTSLSKQPRALVPVLLFAIGIPLALLALSQPQDIRQEASELRGSQTVVTSDPNESLNINISTEDGTTTENEQDGNSGNGSDSTDSGNADEPFVCLGCPAQEGLSEEGGSTDCGNLGDIERGETINIDCSGGTNTDDQSGQDGQNSSSGNNSGSNNTGDCERTRSAGTGAGQGGFGGIMDMIRQRIQEALARFGLGGGGKSGKDCDRTRERDRNNKDSKDTSKESGGGRDGQENTSNKDGNVDVGN